MIGRLRGQLVHVGDETILVETGGVGYEVQVPASTRQILPPVGQEVILWCRLYIREDDLRLFGFASLVERELFDHLLSINGVGPRLALAVLSTYSPARFFQAVARNDLGALTRIPGVGRKTAERWLLELRGKFPARMLTAGGDRDPAPSAFGSAAASAAGRNLQSDGHRQESGMGVAGLDAMTQAQEALLVLGYSAGEADGVLRELVGEGIVTMETPVEAWVKHALRRLASRVAHR